MKIIGFALILLMVALRLPALSQTLSGYVDGEPPVDPHPNYPAKKNWLEYQGIPFEGWQATLRLSTNTFQVGSNIHAELVIKNVSTNELNLSEAWPLLANGFSVHILNKDKAEVPLTSIGKAQKSSGSASPNISHRVPPGKEIAVPLELSKLYQLESPGVYTVQATRSLTLPDSTRKLALATGVARIAIEGSTGQGKN